jgi:hypothetical protein
MMCPALRCVNRARESRAITVGRRRGRIGVQGADRKRIFIDGAIAPEAAVMKKVLYSYLMWRAEEAGAREAPDPAWR